MYGNVPMTPPDVSYGTPRLAREILHLFRSSDLESAKFFVMAGHQDGIVSFGLTLEEAASRMLDLL